MPYRIQYSIAWVLFVLGLALTLTTTQAETLGLSKQGLALITIALGVIAGVQPFLPKLQRPPSDQRTGMD